MTAQLRDSSMARLVSAHQSATRPLRRQDAVQSIARNIRSLVLLSGAVRPPVLSAVTGRSLLDFPLDHDSTFTDYWQRESLGLVRLVECDVMQLRVLLAHNSVKPQAPGLMPHVRVDIERDPMEFRGIGGVLRDLSRDYDKNDFILVANGAQLLTQSLNEIVTDLCDAVDQQSADVVLVSHRDGTPGGVMLVRCGALDCVPELGYVDMKEQALPLISQHHHVHVVQSPNLTGIPVRTLSDYMQALRWRHRKVADQGGDTERVHAFAEDWKPTFRIVESGASVDADARVMDSVVLRGGRVEKGSVLVRCVVGPGGVVSNRVVSECLIGTADA